MEEDRSLDALWQHGKPTSATPLTHIFRNLAVFLALIVGVHRVVIGSLLVSFKLIPAGAVAGAEASVPVILQLTAQTLAAGVRMALPIIAILFITLGLPGSNHCDDWKS